MRTIKFRGKRLDTGKWEYGDLMHDDRGGSYVFPIDAENLYREYEVVPDTVGQFIGLRDGKGREIYEGDIIYSEFGDGSNVKLLVGWNEEASCFGLMDEYAYRFKQKGYDFPEIDSCELFNFRMDSKVFEVIGNIHDTPEQLNARTTT